MLIKFKRGFIGRETAMQEYKKGDTAEIPTAQALALLALEVAVEVEEMKKKVKHDQDT